MESNGWLVVFLVFLILLSGFFSAAETALMSLNKIKIKQLVEDGVKGAKEIQEITDNPSETLSTILVCNNIVNILASSVSTVIFINLLDRFGTAVATSVSTLVLTIVILIFGEITPKTIAVIKAEKLAFALYKPLKLVLVLLKPIVFIFSKISKFIMLILGIKEQGLHTNITEEELKSIVSFSQEEGVLEVEDKKLIYNVFEFGDLKVKDVMIPRVDMITLSKNSTYDEIVSVFKTERFSRVPVYKDNIDNIIGVINIKDLFFIDKEDDFVIDKYIRDVHSTHEYKKIRDLFNEMKKKRNHMAIVRDEYGGTIGLVTIEDLIEEIVGDIEDEYDEVVDKEIQVVNEKEYLIVGTLKIDTLNDMLGINIESEFETIGGYIIEKIGRLPQNGEIVEVDNVKFKIENIGKNRIKGLRVYFDNDV
ncbi:MAG TPA: HlyC/CorC family transporter [Candidatus Stercorousia faecigallinarum]|uniref:HlyC/CorC family transporter n=1 Tax=Candidatus Caccosoma faecigallinarum TaxID=2840720 RepID=A0A9D1GAJ1_9FIRM|nr:HlyC/CorC family transporter [Candidatus Caccosoma faecigallinarum]HIT92815.1 HlyC/CorC family transporter [Candidatus Stercorousia faecigallinarum]